MKGRLALGCRLPGLAQIVLLGSGDGKDRPVTIARPDLCGAGVGIPRSELCCGRCSALFAVQGDFCTVISYRLKTLTDRKFTTSSLKCFSLLILTAASSSAP